MRTRGCGTRGRSALQAARGVRRLRKHFSGAAREQGTKESAPKQGREGEGHQRGANSSAQILPTNDMMGGRNTLIHYSNEAYYVIAIFLGGNGHRGQKPLKCLFPLTQDIPFLEIVL